MSAHASDARARRIAIERAALTGVDRSAVARRDRRPSTSTRVVRDGANTVRSASWVPTARQPLNAATDAPAKLDQGSRLLIGVSTFQRLPYLERFITSFAETRNRSYRWTLVVADDGSNDGSVEFVKRLRIDGVRIVVVSNFARGIAGQTNSILSYGMVDGFDLGFKCDDDIFFEGPGWDDLYVSAVNGGHTDHLVYHSTAWKPAVHQVVHDRLRSSVPVDQSMGCFYTFTPRVVARIGYMDEVNFRVRGHAHIDWSTRACRAGFNDAARLWDANGSDDLIGLWGRAGYVETLDWSSEQVRNLLTDDERARRAGIIADPARVHVPWVDPEPQRVDSVVRSLPRGRQEDGEPGQRARLEATHRFVFTEAHHGLFDAAFVLNLRRKAERYETLAQQLRALGISVERWPGVDGNSPEVVAEWRRYISRGLESDLDRRLGRRAIQSPGAWAYLTGLRSLLVEAKRRRLGRIALFDDDVHLHTDFSERLRSVAAKTPDDQNVLFLGATQRNWQGVEIVEGFHRPNEFTDGSFAVIIDHRVFDELISHIDDREAPFDAGPLREVVLADPDRASVVHPPLVVPDVTVSDIRSGRNQEDFAAMARWRLQEFPTLGAGNSRAPRPLASILIDVSDDHWVSPQTWASVQRQSFPDFEIVLLDRTTTTSGRETLLRLARADTRTRLLDGSGLIGRVEALNALVASARGEAILVQPTNLVAHRQRVELCLEGLQGPTGSWACTGQISVDAVGQPRRLMDGQFVIAGGFGRGLVERCGSLLAADEGGLREALDRVALASGSGLGAASSPATQAHAVPLLHVALDTFGHEDWLAAMDDAEWRRFHEELRDGARPAFLTAEVGTLPPEIVAPELS